MGGVVVGQDGDAEEFVVGCGYGVGGEVGEVDCTAVAYGFEGAGSVEVAGWLREFGLGWCGSFGLFGYGTEGSGLNEFVGV